MADNYDRFSIGFILVIVFTLAAALCVSVVSVLGAWCLMIPALCIFAWCVGYALDKAGLL